MNIKQYFNAFVRRPPRTAVELAQAAALLVEKPRTRATGSAVLVGPDTVLTVAHNFMAEVPSDVRFHHRASGRTTHPVSVDLHEAEDLAIVTLDTPLPGPFAVIERRPGHPELYQPVFMPRQFSVLWSEMGRYRNVQDMLEDGHRSSALGAMLALNETTELKGYIAAWDHPRMSTAFRMISDPGLSGAGIYSRDGRLLTINMGAKHGRAFGCAIGDFQRLTARIAPPTAPTPPAPR